MSVVCTSCNVLVPQKTWVRVVLFTGLEIGLEDFLDTAEKVHKMSKFEAQQAFLTLSRHPRLLGYEFKEVEKELMVEADKVFDGTEEQALEAGWQENEFGFVCTTCAGEQFDDPEGERQLGADDPLIKAALGMALVKATPAGEVLTPATLCGDGTVDIDVIIENLNNLPEGEQAEAALAAADILEGVAQDSDPETAASLRESANVLNNYGSED